MFANFRLDELRLKLLRCQTHSLDSIAVIAGTGCFLYAQNVFFVAKPPHLPIRCLFQQSLLQFMFLARAEWALDPCTQIDSLTCILFSAQWKKSSSLAFAANPSLWVSKETQIYSMLYIRTEIPQFEWFPISDLDWTHRAQRNGIVWDAGCSFGEFAGLFDKESMFEGSSKVNTWQLRICDCGVWKHEALYYTGVNQLMSQQRQQPAWFLWKRQPSWLILVSQAVTKRQHGFVTFGCLDFMRR